MLGSQTAIISLLKQSSKEGIEGLCQYMTANGKSAIIWATNKFFYLSSRVARKVLRFETYEFLRKCQNLQI